MRLDDLTNADRWPWPPLPELSHLRPGGGWDVQIPKQPCSRYYPHPHRPHRPRTARHRLYHPHWHGRGGGAAGQHHPHRTSRRHPPPHPPPTAAAMAVSGRQLGGPKPLAAHCSQPSQGQ